MISFNNCPFTDTLRLGQPHLHLLSLGVGVGSRDCDREAPPNPICTAGSSVWLVGSRRTQF